MALNEVKKKRLEAELAGNLRSIKGFYDQINLLKKRNKDIRKELGNGDA